MDEIKIIQTLGTASGQEPIPEIDVTDRVMQHVRTCAQPSGSLMWGMTATAAAAAIIVAIMAIQTLNAQPDPVQMFLGSVSGGGV